MYHILLLDGRAVESIPASNPDFPGVPIEKRYAPDFLSRTVVWPEPVELWSVWDPDHKTFGPPDPPADAPIDESEPDTPSDQRKRAYETQPAISWGGAILTVDEAAALWLAYSAEANPKAEQLSELIAQAKNAIREQFPD